MDSRGFWCGCLTRLVGDDILALRCRVNTLEPGRNVRRSADRRSQRAMAEETTPDCMERMAQGWSADGVTGEPRPGGLRHTGRGVLVSEMPLDCEEENNT
jgi:hypothetical protein